MNLYWYFAQLGENGEPCLRHGEVRLGETLAVNGELVKYRNALHASRTVMDALILASELGALALCRVELSGTIKHYELESIARKWTPLAVLPAWETDVLLRSFARWCALDAADLWQIPKVTRQYLETGDPELRHLAQRAAEIIATARGELPQSAANVAVGAAAKAAVFTTLLDYAQHAAVETSLKAASAIAAHAEDAIYADYDRLRGITNVSDYARQACEVAFAATRLRQREQLEKMALAALART